MASSGSDKECYHLIKSQRKIQDASLSFLTVDIKILHIPESIFEGCASYF